MVFPINHLFNVPGWTPNLSAILRILDHLSMSCILVFGSMQIPPLHTNLTQTEHGVNINRSDKKNIVGRHFELDSEAASR